MAGRLPASTIRRAVRAILTDAPPARASWSSYVCAGRLLRTDEAFVAVRAAPPCLPTLKRVVESARLSCAAFCAAAGDAADAARGLQDQDRAVPSDARFAPRPSIAPAAACQCPRAHGLTRAILGCRTADNRPQGRARQHAGAGGAGRRGEPLPRRKRPPPDLPACRRHPLPPPPPPATDPTHDVLLSQPWWKQLTSLASLKKLLPTFDPVRPPFPRLPTPLFAPINR